MVGSMARPSFNPASDGLTESVLHAVFKGLARYEYSYRPWGAKRRLARSDPPLFPGQFSSQPSVAVGGLGNLSGPCDRIIDVVS